MIAESSVAYRILIADDHDLVRRALRGILESHADWEVCAEARNGLEAVQKTAELKPDVVILDLVMPEMNGLQAANKILAAAPRMPILLHTNHAYPTLAAEAEKSGICCVINKGGSADQLTTAIEAALHERLLERPKPLLPQGNGPQL